MGVPGCDVIVAARANERSRNRLAFSCRYFFCVRPPPFLGCRFLSAQGVQLCQMCLIFFVFFVFFRAFVQWGVSSEKDALALAPLLRLRSDHGAHRFVKHLQYVRQTKATR